MSSVFSKLDFGGIYKVTAETANPFFSARFYFFSVRVVTNINSGMAYID